MVRFHFLLAGLAVAVSSANAEITECSNRLVRVNTGDTALAATVCDISTDAIAAMQACNLPFTVPVEIDLIGNIDQIGGNALGAFQSAERRISIFAPGDLPDVIDQANPFRHIDTDTYFASLLVHELGHAAFDEVPCPGESCSVASAYVANAMQIRFLPISLRAEFLESWPIERDIAQAELNAFLDSVAPMVFAAKTWRHFSSPGNGCDFVRRLVDGEVILDQPEE